MLDDAYIHLAIAKNLASTGTFGLRDTTLAASTSVGWTIVLAVLEFFAVSSPESIFHLNLLLTFLTSVFAMLSLKAQGLNQSTPYFFALFCVVLPLSIWGIFSGLELSFVNFCFTLFMYISSKNRSCFLVSFASALLLYSRPEFLCLIPFVTLLVNQRAKFIVLTTLFIAPWFLLNYKSHERLLPTTYYAKIYLRGLGLENFLESPVQLLPIISSVGIRNIEKFFSFFIVKQNLIIGILFLIGMASFKMNRFTVFLSLGFLTCLAAQSFFTPPSELSNYMGRHWAYYLPIVCYFAALGAKAILNQFKRGKIFAAVILVALILTSFLEKWPSLANFLRAGAASTHELYTVMPKWVAENIDPAEPLVAADIGGLAYFTKNPIYDIMGIASPELWHLVKRNKDFRLKTFRRIVDYISAKGVKYYILNDRVYGQFLNNCFTKIKTWREKYDHKRYISPISLYLYQTNCQWQ